MIRDQRPSNLRHLSRPTAEPGTVRWHAEWAIYEFFVHLSYALELCWRGTDAKFAARRSYNHAAQALGEPVLSPGERNRCFEVTR